MSYRSFIGLDWELDSLSGIEGLWKPPAGFSFPTNAQYLTNLTKGMADIRPIIESKIDSFIAPIKSQASSVISTVEGTSKVAIPIGGDALKIASAAMAIGSSKDAVSIVTNVGALLNGTLSLVTDVANVLPQLTGALSVVPIVGHAASAIISVMVPFIKFATSAELAQQEAKAAFEQCLAEKQKEASGPCLAKYKSQVNVFGTGEKGAVTPADLFRPFLYWAKTDWPKSKNRSYGGGFWWNEEMDAAWVPTLGSMFVALCGDQVEKDFFKSGVKPPFLFKNYGKMSADTRRRMWGLVKGIMAATENPDKGPGPNAGGMALFPALQGLIWREFDNGTLTDTDVADAAKDLSDPFVLSGYRCNYTSKDNPGDHWQDVTALCGPYVAGSLFDSFMQTKLQFRSQYFTGDLGWDPVRGVFNLKSVHLMAYRKPAASLKLLSNTRAMKTLLKGVGVYDKASAENAAKAAKEAEIAAAKEASMAKLSTGALVLGGAGVAAYLIANRKKWS